MEQLQILLLKQLIGEIEVGIDRIDEKFNEFNSIKEDYNSVKNKFIHVKKILSQNITSDNKSGLSGGKSL